MSDEPIYSRLADDEEIGEIVALYAAEMPERAEGLRRELEAGNRSQLGELVHRLKGSAGSHGFESITAVARELDSLLKSGGGDESVEAMTAVLIDMCLRVRPGKA